MWYHSEKDDIFTLNRHSKWLGRVYGVYFTIYLQTFSTVFVLYNVRIQYFILELEITYTNIRTNTYNDIVNTIRLK